MTTSLVVHPRTLSQWASLTSRHIRLTMGSSVYFFVAVPAIVAIGFYSSLNWVMTNLYHLDYKQFIMAIIVLQSISLTAMTAAFRAANESFSKIEDRIKTTPLRPSVYLAARMTGTLFDSSLALAAAVACGLVIGFRLQGGLLQSALFIAFALLVSLVLCLATQTLGSWLANPAVIAPFILVPSLVFGMISTGFSPESGFPRWIQPFVRNQPISQFAITLRALADEGATWHLAMPSLIWLGALATVTLPLAVWVLGRRP